MLLTLTLLLDLVNKLLPRLTTQKYQNERDVVDDRLVLLGPTLIGLAHQCLTGLLKLVLLIVGDQQSQNLVV
jgi:hypothetical protein